MVDIKKEYEESGTDLVLNLDLINFIEVLGEKYNFNMDSEWKLFNE